MCDLTATTIHLAFTVEAATSWYMLCQGTSVSVRVRTIEHRL